MNTITKHKKTECNHVWKRVDNNILLSMPPKLSFYCMDCGETEYTKIGEQQSIDNKCGDVKYETLATAGIPA